MRNSLISLKLPKLQTIRPLVNLRSVFMPFVIPVGILVASGALLMGLESLLKRMSHLE